MKKNSTIHIVIFADEYFQSQNHLQIDTIRCYTDNKSFQLHIFGLDTTPKCNHSINLHRRHCLLADIMSTNVYLYILGEFALWLVWILELILRSNSNFDINWAIFLNFSRVSILDYFFLWIFHPLKTWMIFAQNGVIYRFFFYLNFKMLIELRSADVLPSL